VALRRLTDHIRSEVARRRREDAVAADAWAQWAFVPAPDAEPALEQDDTLAVLFMCCHPVLTMPLAIALTLRALGGLTTAEIARAFLVPEATMAQRISRAKQSIRASGMPFRMPEASDLGTRLAAVLRLLYLMFTEGSGARWRSSRRAWSVPPAISQQASAAIQPPADQRLR
jgi:predicted RNA polymerase sigma factor